MSDRAVARAVEEAIKNHEAEISKQIVLQGHVHEMMMSSGMTDHSLYSLTTRYKQMDQVIGDRRTAIRNLKDK